MSWTAVAAPGKRSRPLYVLQLEECIRVLDRLIYEEMPIIRADRPQDHGIEQWVAELVVALRVPDPSEAP